MRMPYGEPQKTQKTEATAKEILNLLIGARITYQEAEDSLSLAQIMLATMTKPTVSETLH